MRALLLFCGRPPRAACTPVCQHESRGNPPSFWKCHLAERHRTGVGTKCNPLWQLERKAEVLIQKNYDWLLTVHQFYVFRPSVEHQHSLSPSEQLPGVGCACGCNPADGWKRGRKPKCEVMSWEKGLLCNWKGVRCANSMAEKGYFSQEWSRIFFFFIPNRISNSILTFSLGKLEKKKKSFFWNPLEYFLWLLVLFGKRALWFWLKTSEQNKRKLPTMLQIPKKELRMYCSRVLRQDRSIFLEQILWLPAKMRYWHISPILQTISVFTALKVSAGRCYGIVSLLFSAILSLCTLPAAGRPVGK